MMVATATMPCGEVPLGAVSHGAVPLGAEELLVARRRDGAVVEWKRRVEAEARARHEACDVVVRFRSFLQTYFVPCLEVETRLHTRRGGLYSG